MNSKHAKPDEPAKDSIEFTIEDSQQLAAFIDPHERAREWASQHVHGGGTEAYWAAVDAYVVGWLDMEEIYEGRRREAPAN